MIIVQELDFFLVKENDVVLYTAKSLDEAQGFIEWKTRVGAGDGACNDC